MLLELFGNKGCRVQITVTTMMVTSISLFSFSFLFFVNIVCVIMRFDGLLFASSDTFLIILFISCRVFKKSSPNSKVCIYLAQNC